MTWWPDVSVVRGLLPVLIRGRAFAVTAFRRTGGGTVRSFVQQVSTGGPGKCCFLANSGSRWAGPAGPLWADSRLSATGGRRQLRVPVRSRSPAGWADGFRPKGDIAAAHNVAITSAVPVHQLFRQTRRLMGTASG